MAHISTLEVTRKVGIGRATLERWLAEGKIPAPKSVQFGGSTFRDWAPADIKRLLKFKEKNYRKGRGRKPKRVRP
jgi:excisionase family DNA binding protein